MKRRYAAMEGDARQKMLIWAPGEKFTASATGPPNSPASSFHSAKHGFEIPSFRNVQQERMVAARPADPQHLNRPPRLPRRPSNRVQKRLFADQPGATARQKYSARRHRLERQPIHIQ